MPPNNKTFYEILGVGRNAKATDIARAYARIKADMQKETTAPNPRLAAMAKVAYETLSDPERRAEYDATLGIVGRPPRTGRGGMLAISLAVAVAALAGAGYWFIARPGGGPAQPSAHAASGPQEILQAVAPHVGQVQAALMSGEVRDLGTALATGDGEMVTTCRGIAAGMQLTVNMGGFAAKAEVARAHEELDVCTLAVKGATAGIKVRQGIPAPSEKLQAVFAGPGGPQARQVAIAAAIDDPKGAALEIKAGAPLPNGAALFDSQARLVGIVVAPHAYGEGKVAALGASRLAQARGLAAPAVAAVPPVAASSASPLPAPASATEASAPLPSPATRRGGRGTMLEEGFSSLWREDSEGRLVEVLDNIRKADVGNPLAYWTRWSGRDSASPQVVHCRITYGAEESIVVDDDQISDQYPADGYWYCAFTRFQVELDQIPEGEYRFTIFVNREQVAESSIRVEKRFFTRGTYAVIVVVVGLLLLAFLRRNKVAGRG